MAVSKIKKTIVRGIQTKQYEQLNITVELEEEIEWEDDKEREKKVKETTDKVLDDFVNTYNQVCETLKIDRCIGVVDIKKNVTNDNFSQNECLSSDEIDFWE